MVFADYVKHYTRLSFPLTLTPEQASSTSRFQKFRSMMLDHLFK